MPNKQASLCLFLWLAVLGATAGAARSPISLDILRRDGYGSVDLIKSGANRLFVPADVNGKKFKLLLDTGFGVEGIGIGGTAAELRLTPLKEKKRTIVQTAGGAVGALEAGMAQSVVLGNVHIQGAPIYVYKGSGGVLGRGFLHTNSAIIDLTNLKLYLRPPRTGKGADLGHALAALGMGQASFAGMTGGTYTMDVEVNGVPTKLVIDTGAQMTVLDTRFAKQAKLRGWDRRGWEAVDAAGVRSEMDFAGTNSFKIGGIPIRTPTITMTTIPYYSESGGKVAGVLGLDVLGLNWSIIDFGQNKLYFARAK